MSEKGQYLSHFLSGFKGIVVNRPLLSLHGGEGGNLKFPLAYKITFGHLEMAL